MNKHLLRTAVLAAAVASLAACASRNTQTGEPNENNPRTAASALLTSAAGGTPQPNPQSPVQGTVKFSQVRDLVSVSGTVTGLKPNARHAFHVHEKGDCSSPDFNSAGGHFNPTGQPHGAHNSGKHHVGDMPELTTDANGTANISFNSSSLIVAIKAPSGAFLLFVCFFDSCWRLSDSATFSASPCDGEFGASFDSDPNLCLLRR